MTFQGILMYTAFWIIISERVSLESVLIGAVICTIVGSFNKRHSASKIYNRGLKNIKLQIKYWSLYAWILIKEIILANIHVAKIVLSPNMDISPIVATFTVRLSSDCLRTVLANSITLTPGTLTVDMDGNKLTVHCLKREYADGLINSEFENILLKIEESING